MADYSRSRNSVRRQKSGAKIARERGVSNGKTSEYDVMHLIDRLTAFEDFERDILPAIKKDVKSGMSASELRKKYHALVQARQLTVALTSPDSGKALAAASSILDRVEGKAVEKREVKHTLESLSDAEIDAVLTSEMEDLEDMSDRFEQ